MKKNCWLIIGMMVATVAVAQNNTNPPPVIPAPITQPPAAVAPAAEPVAPVAPVAPVKHKKAPAPKRAAINEPTVSLMPGAAEVEVPNVNVRGQAGLKGEVIARLSKGEVVGVLGQINLDKHEVGEPAQWAKIVLPSSTHVWIHTSFIDATTKTVVPKHLNLRAGPGENFSVLGVIERGAAVKEITTKGAWTQIEPPETAYAFVAAMYLKQEASGSLAANPVPSTETEPAPTPTPTPVAEAAPIVTAPATVITPDAAAVAAAVASAVVPANPLDVTVTNPPPPRVVSHEGVVRPVGSIIAPTAYLLYDPSTGAEVNYLHTTSPSLDISRYVGMRIVVTGEEGLAKRWNDTPVMTIQRIVVLDTNAIPLGPRLDYRIPKQIN